MKISVEKTVSGFILFILILISAKDQFAQTAIPSLPDTIFPKNKDWVIECRLLYSNGNAIFYSVNNKAYSIDTTYVLKTSRPVEVVASQNKLKPVKKHSSSAEAPDSLDRRNRGPKYRVRIIDLYTYQINGTDTLSLAGVNRPRILDERKPEEIQEQKILVFVINTLSKGIQRIDFEGNPDNREGYVILDDHRLLNAVLLQEGYAKYDKKKYTRYASDFGLLERSARDGSKGLWGNWYMPVIKQEKPAAEGESEEKKGGGLFSGGGTMGTMLNVMKTLISPDAALQGMLKQGKWKGGGLDNLDKSLEILGVSKNELPQVDAQDLIKQTEKKKK